MHSGHRRAKNSGSGLIAQQFLVVTLITDTIRNLHLVSQHHRLRLHVSGGVRCQRGHRECWEFRLFGLCQIVASLRAVS